MREIGRALARLSASWQSDAILGGLTVAWMLGYQQVNGVPWAQRGPAIGFGLAFVATLPLRRLHPVAAGSAFGVILLALSAARLRHAAGASLEFFAWMPFFAAYSAGAMADLIPGLAAATWLAAALLVQARYFNPFLIMITAGPWLAGRVVRSRREVALTAIAEAAGSAQAEIGRVVDLLDDHPPGGSSHLRRSVDELVLRARAAGQQVTCRTLAAGGQLPLAASHAVYRAVQEALTNALRHAPGAWVVVTIGESGGRFSVDVENGPSPGIVPGPNWHGTGRGLAGLKERVAACGGSVTAGPTSSGGWLVRAELPAAPRTAAA